MEEIQNGTGDVETKPEIKLSNGPYINTGVKPIITMVGWHTCIRVQKQAIALLERGYYVKLITFKVPVLNNIYPYMTTYTDERELEMKLTYTKCDILHVHNDPDSIVAIAGNMKGNRKLVFDCHDSNFVRHNQKIRQEKMAFEAADAYIFPSHQYQDILMETFSKFTAGKPSAVVWPLCNEKLLRLNSLPRVGGIVYQGNIHAPLPDIQLRLPYRVYTEFTSELTRRNIPFHIYPGSMYPEMRRYQDLGALIYEPADYLQLLRSLSRYDFGLCGAQAPHAQWNACNFPNKCGEYWFSGIPIIVFNSEGCAETIRSTGLGVVCESYDEIESVYNNTTLKEELRKKVQAERHLYTMESHPNGICKTIQIYNEVLSYG